LASHLKGRIRRYSLDDNLLIRVDNDRICIANDKDLRLSVLNDLHDAPIAGHPGVEKTYDLVHRCQDRLRQWGSTQLEDLPETIRLNLARRKSDLFF
jgi:hypothetical protein